MIPPKSRNTGGNRFVIAHLANGLIDGLPFIGYLFRKAQQVVNLQFRPVVQHGKACEMAEDLVLFAVEEAGAFARCAINDRMKVSVSRSSPLVNFQGRMK